MTTVATQEEEYPYPPERAVESLKAGMVQQLRQDLGIKLPYDHDLQMFSLQGDATAMARAKHRLQKLLDTDATIVRVPCPTDVCGRVIGPGGATIRKIKESCNIHRGVNVKSDENSKSMLLTTPFPLDEKTKKQTFPIG